MAAISEINNQANGEPDKKPGPIDPYQLVHHEAGKEDAKNGRLNVDVAPGHHAGEHGRNQDVQHGANQQRYDNAYGQITLWVLGLLGCSRDGIEADVGKEYISSSCPDSRKPVGREAVPITT